MIGELADEERGIILVTGTTGSGKSTTLAAMIDRINAVQHKHIVTVEDPIEFLHTDKRSIINQREIGQDTGSFKRALRRVLRQDPDVILVGEMRDEETVATALSAAETGHLVLSTLHTLDAPETVNRIIDFFPPHMHQQARAMLAGTLKGVVSQRLVRHIDGRSRVATVEILRSTGRVKDMIMNPEETGRLIEVISEGEYYGMQTFDQALLAHVQAGRVSGGGRAFRCHEPSRLQAARRFGRPALDLGRPAHLRLSGRRGLIGPSPPAGAADENLLDSGSPTRKSARDRKADTGGSPCKACSASIRRPRARRRSRSRTRSC